MVGPSFFGGGGVDPARHDLLKENTYHFLDISLHSTEGYSRYKTKVNVKNNLIQPSPPLGKNTKEIRIARTILSPFWLMSYVSNP